MIYIWGDSQMQYICPDCRGSGYVKDKSDHLDICEKCWGLGYIEVSGQDIGSKRTAEERHIRINAFLVLGLSVALFYSVIYIVSLYISYSTFEIIALLLGSYYAGIAGSSIYVKHAMKKMEKKKESGISPGNH